MSNENRNNPNRSRDERETGRDGLHEAQRDGNLGNERNRNSGDNTRNRGDEGGSRGNEDNLGNERGRARGRDSMNDNEGSRLDE